MIKDKLLLYYDKSNDQILSFEIINQSADINIERSIQLFNKVNNITDDSTNMVLLEKDQYLNLFNPNVQNILLFDSKTNTLSVKYQPFNLRRSSAYVYKNMDPKREYSEEQVYQMYNEDYINTNLRNVFKHPQGFKTKWLTLDQISLNEQVMAKNWTHYFNDPYLQDASDNKLKLAESVLEMGTFWPCMVIEDYNGLYSAREGNHRILSLKLAQLYDIVPKDFKLLCIVLPRKVFNYTKYLYDHKLSEPVIGRYSIDAVWGTNHLGNDILTKRIEQNILDKDESILNSYTVEKKGFRLLEMYEFVYIYPLFLRDLLYINKNIKPNPIINNEEVFNSWLEEK